MNRNEPTMRRSLIAIAMLAMSAAGRADTTLIDTDVLPSKQVYGVADLVPLALSTAGAPAVVLLDLEAGDVVPPHATRSGLRLLSVLSGEMSWGDGSTVDEAQETVYSPGSILALPAGLDHWLAARNGPVRLQLVVLDDEVPVSAIQEQMK